ncbi:hypothetical protein BB560_003186 [Smittium megazygosporum]|uniref:Uncharacterized protein n=1 Tax=Smittium megazygosporum TaxID=133381 RepID=A0A2T9ZCS1_9FUNG|nr:hypothetical protein BB560_003186 [Smittium megazygosporum]
MKPVFDQTIENIAKPASALLGLLVFIEFICRIAKGKYQDIHSKRILRKVMFLGFFICTSDIIDLLTTEYFASRLQNSTNPNVAKFMIWWGKFSSLYTLLMLTSILSYISSYISKSNTNGFIEIFDFNEVYCLMLSLSSTGPVIIVPGSYDIVSRKYLMDMTPRGRIMGDLITNDVWVVLSFLVCVFCIVSSFKNRGEELQPQSEYYSLNEKNPSMFGTGLDNSPIDNSSNQSKALRQTFPWIVAILMLFVLPVFVKYASFFELEFKYFDNLRFFSNAFYGMKGFFCIVAADLLTGDD